ncbi:hypothetical protein NC651_019189 [Populus alba x Populus x berolinensis]|nr:hypothetical protein NC651_019189 [Populus alba x Populus x berolinensis]
MRPVFLTDHSPENDSESPDWVNEHREIAKGSCEEIPCAVEEMENLLKSPVVPLPKKAAKILVAGTHADNLGYQCRWLDKKMAGTRGK